MFETTLAAVRLVYAGVFERYPALQMIFPHLGGLAPYPMGRLQWGYERPQRMRRLARRPKPTSSAFTMTLSVETCRPFYGPLDVGAKQIMFGNRGYPLREDIELQRRDIEARFNKVAELDDIYAGNAARLLGISPSG